MRCKLLNSLEAPALLISFYFLEPFLLNQPHYHYRDWAMDSGAFSAHNIGATIDLQEYIECCQKLLKEDKTLTEVFALDVIGNHKKSLKNCEKMWEAGVEAIPTYHIGEPESALKYIAKHYPKIALGGVARLKGKVKGEFAKQCFARVWPKKIHGFGFGTEEHVMMLPWHSTDSTNWELGPCGFGRWAAFGRMTVRGSTQNLRAEVEWHLRLERKARRRWEKEMSLLDNDKHVLRLALGGNTSKETGDKGCVRRRALMKKPDIRLAVMVTGQEAKALQKPGKPPAKPPRKGRKK